MFVAGKRKRGGEERGSCLKRKEAFNLGVPAIMHPSELIFFLFRGQVRKLQRSRRRHIYDQEATPLKHSFYE